MSIERGGGVAGLVETTVADAARLAAADAAALRAKVDECGFFELPVDPVTTSAGGGTAAGGADRFAYAVTIEDGDRTHMVRRSDADLPDGLAELIRLVHSLPGTDDPRLDPPG